MSRKINIHAAIFISLLFFFCSAGPSGADTIAFTDFGTTPGAAVSTFTTEYTKGEWGSTGVPPAGEYVVATDASTFGLDWGGLDHTNPGTGCFMVVNRTTDLYLDIISYTFAAVAGQQYTLTGWVQNILSNDGSRPALSFWVNGVQQPGFFMPFGAHVWHQFTFNYTPSIDGPMTFALHDINHYQDPFLGFGLDDIRLTGPSMNPVPLPGAVWLLGSGLLSLAGWRRFRKS